MPFHQQHFHDAFKTGKSYVDEKKNTCGKQAEEKISTHNTHTHNLF